LVKDTHFIFFGPASCGLLVHINTPKEEQELLAKVIIYEINRGKYNNFPEWESHIKKFLEKWQKK